MLLSSAVYKLYKSFCQGIWVLFFLSFWQGIWAWAAAFFCSFCFSYDSFWQGIVGFVGFNPFGKDLAFFHFSCSSRKASTASSNECHDLWAQWCLSYLVLLGQALMPRLVASWQMGIPSSKMCPTWFFWQQWAFPVTPVGSLQYLMAVKLIGKLLTTGCTCACLQGPQ